MLCVLALVAGLAALAGCSDRAGTAPADAAATGRTPAATASARPATDAGPGQARPVTATGVAGWRITQAQGKAPGLQAWVDRVSVRPGDPVGLYVDAAGPVRVRALRIGEYGGDGAAQVWSGSVTAARQPGARPLAGAVPGSGGLARAHLVVAPWRRTAELDTTGWPEGDYLLRLDAGRAARYVPLTVRSADARGRVLVLAGALTWEAYNGWGGGSLYDGDDGSFAGRSLAVSFDRPYDDGYGAGRFFLFDEPLARLVDGAGLPVAWATDYDLAVDPHLADGAAAIVVGGHAEYWTGPMRDAVTRAVAAGTNLAVLGANTAYWRVRLAGTAGSADGRPRVVVGTKNPHLDPLARSDPGGATARFRDAPAPRREEALTGMRYDCYPAQTSWTVADPAWWGYAGTGVRAGERLPGVVGPEADRVYPVAGRPVPEQVVAYQPYSCGPHARTVHTAVYWTAPSGAGVFAAGTMRWVCAIEPGCTGVPGTRASAVVRRVTLTLLTAFAQPRAGLAHPATDTVPRFALPARATTPAT